MPGGPGLGLPPGKADSAAFRGAPETIRLAAAGARARLRQTGKPVASLHSLAPFGPLDRERRAGASTGVLRNAIRAPELSARQVRARAASTLSAP